MKSNPIYYLTQHSSDYPSILIDRLGTDAPERLAYIGNIRNLFHRKTAIFCSRDAPGNVILHTFDKVAEFRDRGCCINRESALFRNRFVSALCDEAFISFAEKDSYTENIIRLLHSWDVRCYKPDV